jgi:hypothetical protein
MGRKIDSENFGYVMPTGILSTIIAVLLVLAAMVAYGTLTFAQVFNIPMVLVTLFSVCIVFFILSTALHQMIIDKIQSRIGIGIYITIAVFASIEIFNIIFSLATHTSYYPTDPAYYNNFWTSRLYNLVFSVASTGTGIYVTWKNLNTLSLK